MPNFIIKWLFQLKQPSLIAIFGQDAELTAEAICHVLGKRIKTKKIGDGLGLKDFLSVEVFIASGLSGTQFLGVVRQPLLVITRGNAKEIESALKIFRPEARVFINCDDEAVNYLAAKININALKFGFNEDADFRATDIFITKSQPPGMNFKINHDGKIVPIWLPYLSEKENVYAALAASAVGVAFKLNLVEISQALNDYKV